MYTGKRWNKVNTSATNNVTSTKESIAQAIKNRENFVPEIVNSRQDTGEHHPKRALLIMGHGEEGWVTNDPITNNNTAAIRGNKWKVGSKPDYVRVPKGSIVVVKPHSGESAWQSQNEISYMNVLAKENERVILDPVRYIDDIVRLFGNVGENHKAGDELVAIYREGDLCPNFNYILIAKNMGDFNDIELSPSGIVSIPLKERMSASELEPYLKIRHIPKTMTIKEYKAQRDTGVNIEDLLKLSTDANGEQILLNNFKAALETYDENKTFGEIFLDRKILGRNTIKQSTIFEQWPNTITYNFECRYIPSMSDIYDNFLTEAVRLGASAENANRMISTDFIGPSNIGFRKYKNMYTGPNKTPSNTRNRRRVSNMAPEIKDQISESILQRRLAALAFSRNKLKNTTLKNYRNRIKLLPSSLRRQDLNSLISAIERDLPDKRANKYKYLNLDDISNLNKFRPDVVNSLINSQTSAQNANMSLLLKLREKFPTRKNKINVAITRLTPKVNRNV